MAEHGYVIVGRIKRAHGIRGEIVVEPMTDEPDAVFASGRRVIAGNMRGDVDEDASELHVSGLRPMGDNLLLQVDEVKDRNDAELWRGRYLFVPEAEVTQPEEGEVFIHELPGMLVESAAGRIYGEVLHTFDFPQGLMLEVRQPGGTTAMLPFRAELILSVDREARRIVVDVPLGLFDEEPG
jgi:16S rRNA processing protein RimM